MSWMALVAVLGAWLVVGMGVAYLFGSFIREVESPENAGDLVPPVVSYLRPLKRAKTTGRLRAAARIRAQREATGGH
jgi:hypothetical protein